MQEEILGDKCLAAPAAQLHPGSPIRRLWKANELSTSCPELAPLLRGMRWPALMQTSPALHNSRPTFTRSQA